MPVRPPPNHLLATSLRWQRKVAVGGAAEVATEVMVSVNVCGSQLRAATEAVTATVVVMETTAVLVVDVTAALAVHAVLVVVYVAVAINT